MWYADEAWREDRTYLFPPITRQLNPMIRDELMNIPIPIPLTLRMPNQNDHLPSISYDLLQPISNLQCGGYCSPEVSP